MNAPSSFPATLSQEVRDIGSDWRKVSGPICNGNPCGPDWIVRVISTGKLYRIGDFTFQRMLKYGAEPTPYGWLEIDEDGLPVEADDDDTLNDIAAENEAARDDEFNTWEEEDD